MHIALATADGADDEDLPLLTAACTAAGMTVRAPVWDDPGVDWAAFDLVVVRSTWDYARRRDAFVAWAHAVSQGTRILNPPHVLAWTTDKRYLDELRQADLPVVPTRFVAPGEPWSAPTGEFVIKPAVSAGSQDTVRYAPGDHDRASAHVAALTEAGRVAMVQPYQAAVDRVGERALVYVDHVFSHALTKEALLAPGAAPPADGMMFAPERISAADPSADELLVGDRVMDWLGARFGALLYARIDLVADAAGRPHVLEVELAEPSLFHAYAPASAARFAAAIRARVA